MRIVLHGKTPQRTDTTKKMKPKFKAEKVNVLRVKKGKQKRGF